MKAQPLEWDDLRFVLAVCRSGTLSGAARKLGVNHSTVFRRINAIEEKLGVRLFERLPNGYAMTEAGEAVHTTGERIEHEVFGLSRQLIGGDLRLHGTLRVTAPDAIAFRLLMPHITAFCKTYPDIQLDLVVANNPLDLSQREADIAIRVTTAPPDAVVGRRLCKLARTIYGSRHYLETNAESKPKDYDWLMPNEGLNQLIPHEGSNQLPINKWLEQHYPSVNVVLHSNTLFGLYEAAKLDLGVAPLPCFLADPDNSLRRIMPPPKELASELWLLTHSDLRRTARVRAFVDFLETAMKGDKALIEGRASNKS